MKERLASWAEVDEALRKMGTLAARAKQKNAQMVEEVNRLVAQSKPEVEALKLEVVRLEAELEDFCRRHRADFRGKRSRKLNFGTVAFRLVTTVELPEDEGEQADLAARLETDGHESCVVTKKSLVQGEIKKLPGEVLDELGLKRTTRDSFKATPERKEIELTEEES